MNVQTAIPDAVQSLNDVPPLRVLLTGYRSHPHVGGQGVYLRELACALRDLGHSVTIASGPPYPEIDEGIALVKLPSLNLFEVENAFTAFRPGFLTRWADLSEWASHNVGQFGELYAFAHRLKRHLADNPDSYDIIHDNQTLSTPFRSIAQRHPVVTTIHHPIIIDREFALQSADGFMDRLFTRQWYRFVTQQAKTMRHMDHLLAVSEASRVSHVARYGIDPDKISVALNGIDHTVFYPDADTQRQTNLIAATSSADVPIKGVDVLMKAFCALAPTRPDLRLELIGHLRDGPAKRHLEAAGLEDRVTCRSGVTREEIADLYRRASLVICPARFEGFGFPAAEAMACGAPVIASDGGALPEVVGEAGLIVPAGDDPALRDAMESLLGDPVRAKALGRAGAIRAKADFSWPAHAEAAVSLYRKAIARC